jgi:hypothetical protein
MGDMADAKDEVCKLFESSISSDQVIIHHQTSEEACKEFKDDYFDWIYVDASHQYTHVLSDLTIYHSKVKSWVMGHDFAVIGRTPERHKNGVIRAVVECIQAGMYEMVGITREKIPSFCLKVIK